MTRKTRFHVGTLPPDMLKPKHLTLQDFGRRVYARMIAKGWNQSELARRADLPRDSVSTYVRGVVSPTPVSLEKLARALDCEVADLFPNAIESAIDADHPALEIRVSPSAPSMAWLRVNQLVPISLATQIAQILADNETSDPD